MFDALQVRLSTATLETRIKRWADVVGVSMSEAIKRQSILLMKDLVRLSPPKSRDKANKIALNDIREVYRPRPVDMFNKRQRGGSGGMTWLYAGPKYLVGVKNEDFQARAEASSIVSQFYAEKKKTRGKAWSDLGLVKIIRQVKAGRFVKSKRAGKKGVVEKTTESPQHAMILNRIVVGRAAFNNLRRYVFGRMGLQKAAWAVGLFRLSSTEQLPQWVFRHLSNRRAPGKFVNRLQDQPRPFVQMISHATGCEKPKALQSVRAAVRYRSAALLKDMRLYLNGTKKAAGFKAHT